MTTTDRTPDDGLELAAQRLLDALPGSAAVVDRGGRIIAVSRDWTTFAACDPRNEDRESWVGRSYQDALGGEPSADAGLTSVLEGRLERYQHVYPCHAHDVERWYRVVITPIEGHGVLIVHLDLTDERQRAAALTDGSPTPILELDEHGQVTYASATWDDMTGQTPVDAGGLGWLSVLSPEHRSDVREQVGRAVTTASAVEVDARFQGDRWVRFVGRPQVDARGRLRRYVLSAIDVTEDRRAVAHLAHVASHDALTGLQTRSRFRDRLTAALEGMAMRPGGAGIGVLFVDVDDLKTVNDEHGHAAGDSAIQMTAQRILGVLRHGDTAARFGGDEFLVLVARADALEDVSAVGHRIVDAMRDPISIDLDEGSAVQIGVSVGGVHVTRPAPVDDVISWADTAMYVTKRRGKAGATVLPAPTRTAGGS